MSDIDPRSGTPDSLVEGVVYDPRKDPKLNVTSFTEECNDCGAYSYTAIQGGAVGGGGKPCRCAGGGHNDVEHGVYDSGRSYGAVNYKLYRTEFGTNISFGHFFLSGYPKGLEVKECELIIRGFCDGYDYAARSFKAPEKALKQIARKQHEEKNHAD